MIEQAQVAPTSAARDLSMSDLKAALAAGWRDFRAYPAFGLFFASIYVAAGLSLYYLLMVRGEMIWLVAAAAGFPLLGPFTAVGLYEVSRRREAGLPMRWRSILGALQGHGDEQLLLMGGLMFIVFGIWIGLAHGIFAIFTVETGFGAEGLNFLATGAGITMLVVGGCVGALVALGLYAVSVLSLPMLVDRELSFLTAIIASLAAVRANPAVLLGWAILVAVALFAAMIPMLLGLFVVLPVLGHATWHLYRRAMI